MKLFALCLLALSSLTFAEPVDKVQFKVPEAYNQERIVTFNWTLKNDSGRFLKDTSFTVYAPVALTAFQACQSIEADRKFKLSKDNYQNQLLTFNIARFAPYQTLTIRIKSLVKLSKKPQPIALLPADFLAPSTHIQSTAKPVRQHLSRLPEAASQARATYNWLTGNMKKTAYQAKDLGAVQALLHKKGDCSEFASLFAALNRAAAVPTQYLSGYYCPENTALKSGKYHNANFFYTNESWHFADSHHKNFKESHDQFIVFTVHGGKSEDIMQNNYRYLLKGEGTEKLKIFMK